MAAWNVEKREYADGSMEVKYSSSRLFQSLCKLEKLIVRYVISY